MKKAEIQYPCKWTYKVFGQVKTDMEEAVGHLLPGREFLLSESKSKGKFLSLSLELTVNSKEDKDKLFHALKGSDSIAMVL